MNAEAWRPALIAFWRNECCFQRVECLEKFGEPLDHLDLRTIEALKAALALAPAELREAA